MESRDTVNEVLEALMVLSFGISWPASIVKSYTSRTAKGKSLFFMSMIAFGYLCGIAWKVNVYNSTGVWHYPAYFYLLNLVMVCTNIGLYLRNRKLDQRREN